MNPGQYCGHHPRSLWKMHTFGLSQHTVYAGILLLLLAHVHVEITLCYCPFVGSCLPCPPRGSVIWHHGKVLIHPTTGNPVGWTKLQKKSKWATMSSGIWPYFIPALAQRPLPSHSISTAINWTTLLLHTVPQVPLSWWCTQWATSCAIACKIKSLWWTSLCC